MRGNEVDRSESKAGAMALALEFGNLRGDLSASKALGPASRDCRTRRAASSASLSVSAFVLTLSAAFFSISISSMETRSWCSKLTPFLDNVMSRACHTVVSLSVNSRLDVLGGAL